MYRLKASVAVFGLLLAILIGAWTPAVGIEPLPHSSAAATWQVLHAAFHKYGITPYPDFVVGQSAAPAAAPVPDAAASAAANEGWMQCSSMGSCSSTPPKPRAQVVPADAATPAAPQEQLLAPHEQQLTTQLQPTPTQQQQATMDAHPDAARHAAVATATAQAEPHRIQSSTPSSPAASSHSTQLPTHTPASTAAAAAGAPSPSSSSTAAAQSDTLSPTSTPAAPARQHRPPPVRRLLNLAELSDGASVVAANPEARRPERAIDRDIDSFMKNDCEAQKWMMIELSQLGTVETVKLTMKELYSSRVHTFRVFGRSTHPRKDSPDLTASLSSGAWQLLGSFAAENKRGTQSFSLPQRSRVRYLLLMFDTHYGNEQMCAMNWIEVLGVSAAQELEEALALQDMEAEHDELQHHQQHHHNHHPHHQHHQHQQQQQQQEQTQQQQNKHVQPDSQQRAVHQPSGMPGHDHEQLQQQQQQHQEQHPTTKTTAAPLHPADSVQSDGASAGSKLQGGEAGTTADAAAAATGIQQPAAAGHHQLQQPQQPVELATGRTVGGSSSSQQGKVQQGAAGAQGHSPGQLHPEAITAPGVGQQQAAAAIGQQPAQPQQVAAASSAAAAAAAGVGPGQQQQHGVQAPGTASGSTGSKDTSVEVVARQSAATAATAPSASTTGTPATPAVVSTSGASAGEPAVLATTAATDTGADSAVSAAGDGAHNAPQQPASITQHSQQQPSSQQPAASRAPVESAGGQPQQQHTATSNTGLAAAGSEVVPLMPAGAATAGLQDVQQQSAQTGPAASSSSTAISNGKPPAPQQQQAQTGPAVTANGAQQRDLGSLLDSRGSNKPKQAGNLFDVVKSEMMQLKLDQSKLSKKVDSLSKRGSDVEASTAALQQQQAALQVQLDRLSKRLDALAASQATAAAQQQQLRKDVSALLAAQKERGKRGYSTRSQTAAPGAGFGVGPESVVMKGSHMPGQPGSSLDTPGQPLLPPVCARVPVEEPHLLLQSRYQWSVVTALAGTSLLGLWLVLHPKSVGFPQVLRLLVCVLALLNGILAVLLALWLMVMQGLAAHHHQQQAAALLMSDPRLSVPVYRMLSNGSAWGDASV